MLPGLPIPRADWLAAFNHECKRQEIAVGERPFRALLRWAQINGQQRPLGELILAHLGTEAFKTIYEFFKANTSLGCDCSAPIRQSCFLYEGAFWPVYVPVLHGEAVFDPIRFVARMPSPVFHSLGLNSEARNQLDEHWFDCFHHLNNRRLIDAEECSTLGRDFFAGGEKSLLAAVESLLATPPNPKAAELSREAFESTLKGLAVVRTGLRENEAIEIRHRLHELVQRCAPVLPVSEFDRLYAACSVYPPVRARYEETAFEPTELWRCYAEAQHAMSISLHIIDG